MSFLCLCLLAQHYCASYRAHHFTKYDNNYAKLTSAVRQVKKQCCQSKEAKHMSLGKEIERKWIVNKEKLPYDLSE